MSSSLLGVDEETDMGVYGAYLRAQSDTDLLDIALHLDPERYPARLDRAGRELHRRGLLHSSAYTPAEAGVRYCALAALVLALLLLTLTGLLTPTDAAGPTWPTPEMLPDGIRLGEMARLFTVAVLRGGAMWAAHLGLFLLLLGYLGGWLLRAGLVRRGRMRAEVRWLAGLGAAALLLALCAAAGPNSAVPDLFAASAHSQSPSQRCLPLWDPFASAPVSSGV